MKFYNILAAGVVVASAALTSCNDDNTTYTAGFEGVEGQVVLAPTVNASYKVIQVPGADIMAPDIDWQVAPRTRVAATEPMKVKFEIDNALIDAYNAANGTDYVAVPAGIVTLTDAEAVISVGKNTSDTNVGMEMTADQAKLAEMKLDVNYMVPVRLTEITEGEGRIAVSATNVSYVTFSVDEILLKPGGTPTGTTIPKGAGRSGWSMSAYGTTGTYSGGPTTPILSNGGYWYLALQGGGVIIDLGKPYTFDGIYATSSFGSYYYLLVPGVELSYSNDGENFKTIGTMDRTTNVAALYAPITAQYINIYCPDYVLTAWTDFSIYEVQ